MTLAELRDPNGTTLQAFADWFLEKAAECGCRAAIFIVKPQDTLTSTNANPYAIVTNIKGALLPDVFEGVAREMRVAMEEARETKEPS